MPAVVASRLCDLQGRVLVKRNGVGALVPQAGEEVRAHVDFTDGTTDDLLIATDTSGTVTVGRVPTHEEAPAASVPGGGAGNGPCVDPGYLRLNSVEGEQFRMTEQALYWYRDAGRSPNVTLAQAETAIVNGAQNMVLGRNDCGLSAVPRSTNSYQGVTGRDVNIRGDGLACYTADAFNVIAWGNMFRDALAVTCAHSRSGALTDGDIRINNKYNWDHTLTDGCNNSNTAYDITAVVTHEWGHVAGLADLSEASHADLTMSGSIRSCDVSPRTLGDGDHRGMIAIYGAR